jgi:hypothetical protein
MQPAHIRSRRNDRQAKRKKLPANHRNGAANAVITGVAEFEFVGALKSPAPFVVTTEPNAFHGNRPVEQLHAFGFARTARAVERDIARTQTVQPEPAGGEEGKQDAKFDQGKCSIKVNS